MLSYVQKCDTIYHILFNRYERLHNMKILVTGSKGQLGTDVVNELNKRGHEVYGADLPEFDVADRIGIQQYIRNLMPDAVIHLAAYTAVDKAEEDKNLCYAVNVKGTRNIATVCGSLGIKVLFTSTDYVFDGKGETPYEIADAKNPVNYYGETKAQAEEFIIKYCPYAFIVRISWVFGKNGSNFVKTMTGLSKEKDEISVVTDQIGSPTYTPHLAALITDMIESNKYGIYHATNEGFCSWAEFAREIMALSGADTVINEIATSQYPTAAVRPLNSRLSKKSLDTGGFERLPHWKDALKDYFGK